MKRIRLLILPAALALWLTFPQAALAADGSAGAGLKFVSAQAADPPGEGCKDEKCKRTHKGDYAALRVYSAMTGKSVESLEKACADGKMTIWQLAKKDGRLDALKARLLAVRAASLDELVKGGAMTEEERGKILAHIKDELDKK